MKKHFTFILVLLTAVQLRAATFYEQLCAFNPNWAKYKQQVPIGEARNFNSDKEYIQTHLKCVLAVLRSNPTAQLNAAQYNSRMQLIEVLDGYRSAGNFPMNYYRNERIPVFIDEHKTHCAVGYLLQQSGQEAIALRIAAADNYAWVKDIKDAELMEWQESSGFSVEELKLIQGAYDHYIHNAFILPNKYEIPQKPAVITAYFKDKTKAVNAKNTWCRGEGANGVLNGRWEQNYAAGIPWIEGHYEKGKRSGQWKEYYQGTVQLCRTENWRNDKLNGIRKRFSRSGVLIEEILFKNGNAIKKTNYDLEDSLTWIRKPLDSNLVWTEVYTLGGAMIAAGHEKVYNPGNLLWFQNIELTALNSAAITARSASSAGTSSGYQHVVNPLHAANLYNTPPLVQYNKEGEWIYYKEYAEGKPAHSVKEMFKRDYRHFGKNLFQSIQVFDELKINSGYDSVRVVYANDVLQHFYGYGIMEYAHLRVLYHDATEPGLLSFIQYSVYETAPVAPPRIKVSGQYNRNDEKMGVWKYYDGNGELYKTETFIVPRKEEEEEISKKSPGTGKLLLFSLFLVNFIG